MAMFDQTFVDGEGKTHKGWTVVLSFAFQFLLTGILILIPLIYTDVLPQAQLTSMLTAPPPPPPPPPPPTCGTMTASSTFLSYSGMSSGCKDGGNVNCSTGESITFSVNYWQFSPTCATTYTWTVDGQQTAGGQTLTKSFATSGTHSVSCAISNSSQTFPLATSLTVNAGTTLPPVNPTCGTMAVSNTVLGYTGTSAGCISSGSGTCGAGEQINFHVDYSGFSTTCATTYTWTIDGQQTAGGQTLTKSFAASGTHSVSCAISNSSQTFTVASSLTINGQTPVNTNCGTLTANANVFMSYTGPASGCRDGGNCSTGEAIAFSVTYWGLSPTCTATYSWQFDDGGTASGQSASHAFTTTGQHTATCTITYGSQSLPLSTTLNVGGNPATPAPTVTVAVEYVNTNTYKFTPTVVSGTVTKFIWDFGDGTSATTTEAKPVQNMYAKIGKYTVTLEAQSGGPSTTVTTTVSVIAKPRAVRH
jgi:PKD repeat protein